MRRALDLHRSTAACCWPSEHPPRSASTPSPALEPHPSGRYAMSSTRGGGHLACLRGILVACATLAGCCLSPSGEPGYDAGSVAVTGPQVGLPQACTLPINVVDGGPPLDRQSTR